FTGKRPPKQRPARLIEPLEVVGIEPDPRRIAVSPLHRYCVVRSHCLLPKTEIHSLTAKTPATREANISTAETWGKLREGKNNSGQIISRLYSPFLLCASAVCIA